MIGRMDNKQQNFEWDDDVLVVVVLVTKYHNR